MKNWFKFIGMCMALAVGVFAGVSCSADAGTDAEAEAQTVYYTVSFNSDGGSAVEPQQVQSGKTATKPADPTKDGYTFFAWYNGKSAFDFSTPITAHLTLTAHWTKNKTAPETPENPSASVTYTITFVANNGTEETATQTVNYGATETLAANTFAYAGYRFAAWNTAQDGSGSSYSDRGDFAVTEANDITLYAQWAEADRYIITYKNTKDAENTNPTSYRAIEGAMLSDLTAAGYVFDGWYTDDGNKITAIAVGTAMDITLTAKWQANTYTVTLMSNGEPFANALTATYGEKLPNLESVPVSEAQDFLGFYTESDGNGTMYIDSEGKGCEVWHETENTTLHAFWSKAFTVTFETNGGTTVDAQKVSEGKTARQPEEPTQEHHEFAGWYADATFLQPFDFDSPITADTTVYAKWTAFYTVTFESNGGSAVESQVVREGEYATEPEEPTREHYEFAGWRYDSGSGTTYYFWPVYGDLTVYAAWKEIKYAITFNTNGGSMISSQTIPDGEVINKPNAPSRAGYEFVDWYVDSNFTSRFDFSIPPTANTTLYARWVTPNDYYAKINGSIYLTLDEAIAAIYVASEITTVKLGKMVSTLSQSSNRNTIVGALKWNWQQNHENYTQGVSLDMKDAISMTKMYASELSDCPQITSIILPESITIIESKAFSGCSGLTSVILSDGLTSIGNEAFAGCSALTDILIPSGITSIGNETFSGCSALTNILIPSGITVIGENAFKDCTSLTNVSFEAPNTWNAETTTVAITDASVNAANLHTNYVNSKWVRQIGTRAPSEWVLGNIMFSDGSVAAYEDVSTLTEEQKATAIGVIYLYEGKKFVVGLHRGGDESSYVWDTGLAWAKSGAIYANSEYTGDDKTKMQTDGSIAQACIENTSDFSETNYPAFWYAKTYGETHSISGEYATGWYIPSKEELKVLFYNRSNIITSYSLFITLPEIRDKYVWSSTERSYNTAYTINWTAGPELGSEYKGKTYEAKVYCVHAIDEQ